MTLPHRSTGVLPDLHVVGLLPSPNRREERHELYVAPQQCTPSEWSDLTSDIARGCSSKLKVKITVDPIL